MLTQLDLANKAPALPPAPTYAQADAHIGDDEGRRAALIAWAVSHASKTFSDNSHLEARTLLGQKIPGYKPNNGRGTMIVR